MYLHLSMSIITSLTILSTLSFYKYLIILHQNISLALQPQIQQQLSNNQHFISALNKAISNHFMYARIFLPTSILSIIASITIWITLSLEYIIPIELSTILTIIIATSLTKLFTQQQFPKWFFHWSKLIHTTRDEINLQLLHTKLLEVHTKLLEVINGKQLTETELNQLKFESLFLTQQAELLTKQLDQYK